MGLLTARKIRGARSVSAKQVRELSKLAWMRDDALSNDMYEARLLPDGRVLLFWGDGQTGNLHESRASVEQLQRDTAEEAAQGPINLPREFLPPIDDFLRDVEAHAKSLGARIRVSDDVLDETVASLDAVDTALKRIPRRKRLTPDIITPLVAYVGQVMRPICRGRWAKAPTTRKRSVPIFDPAEWAAWQDTYRAIVDERRQVEAAAKARRLSAMKVAQAGYDVMAKTITLQPKPIRYDTVDEPVTGHENEPMIEAFDGRQFQPFGFVVIGMVEPSKRVALRSGVEVTLISYMRPPATRTSP